MLLAWHFYHKVVVRYEKICQATNKITYILIIVFSLLMILCSKLCQHCRIPVLYICNMGLAFASMLGY